MRRAIKTKRDLARRLLVKVVEEFCSRHGVEVALHSDGWVLELRKGRRRHLIFGVDFGLNASSSAAIARDKSATSEVLLANGVPTVAHHLLLRPGTPAALGREETEQQAVYFFRKLGRCVVVKPNDGFLGMDVFRVHSEDRLLHILNRLFAGHRAVAVSPYIAARYEYRVCVLKGQPEITYKKVRQEGSFYFNLSKGARPSKEIDLAILPTLHSLAVDTARVLNLDLVNVDVFEDANGALQVLEVNPGISFELYAQENEVFQEEVRGLYEKILKTLLVNAFQ